MDNDDDIVDKEIVVTLLSNGSSNLFKDNSLTLFSNKLHAPINLNPSNYNYIALQEVGISLNSSNIRIPNEKPAIIYFEWDKTFNKQSEDLSKYHIAKKVFITTYEDNKSTFFSKFPNKFGIYSSEAHIDNRIYNTDTIEEELKRFSFFSSHTNHFFDGKLEINLFKEFYKKQINKINSHHFWWQRFEIKRRNSNLKTNKLNQNLEIGLLIHRNLAEALKLSNYHVKENLPTNSSRIEITSSIEINSETYFLYFIRADDIIRGKVFFNDIIKSNEDNVINIDCNIVDPYISNGNFCNTIATFNNITNKQKFLKYSPNSRTFYKLIGNEIDTIKIRISDKNYNQLNLFPGIPTILKLIMKSKKVMDFTSNLRVSSNASGTSHFRNKNSNFRVVLPSNDIFQSEKSQLSIASITYPNSFKVLPSHLNSNQIKKIYLYSDQHVNEYEMNFFTEEDSELSEDISSDLSLDPVTLITNFNKKFKKDKIKWQYDDRTHRISINTKKNAYLLQIPIPLGNLLGLQETDINFSNPMIANHVFKSTWYYKVFLTEKLVDIMKNENNLSVYELLGKNSFPVDNFFYVALSSNDEFNFNQSINLGLHRPRYALVYNNIIEDSIVDNSYYKILKTIYFEESDSKWNTITYKNDEYKKVQEKTPLYLEFSLRLPSGDLVEFENDEDDVVINLKTKAY